MEVSQIEVTRSNLLLISALRNILSLKFIDNGKSTMFVNSYLQNSYGISIGFLKMSWSTFHGENNRSSLSNLEFIWIFKNSFQNSKSLLCCLTDIDMSAFRVLQNLLRNLIWYQNKSWSKHGGEEHIKSWTKFDSVLVLNLLFT